MEQWMIIALVVAGIFLVGLIAWWVKRSRTSAQPQEKVEAQKTQAPIAETPDVVEPRGPPAAEVPAETKEEAQPEAKQDEAAQLKPVEEPAAEPEPEPVKAPPPSLSERLSKTRLPLLKRLEKFWKSGETFTEDQWEEIEEILLEADVGFTTVNRLLEGVRNRSKDADGKTLKDLMREECFGLFQGSNGLSTERPTPYVISIVGVNGVGKTTTIGKLAHRFAKEGNTVLMGAADTFRAGAISQLNVWADRVGCQFVGGKPGGDPGAVAFDAVSAAKARGMDIALLDTAGRLHTKVNLMGELKKIQKVVKKVIPEAPHETWLVIDGTIGQNSIQQAREFSKELDLSGVIITKLDGSAKGGAVLAIASELNLPIRFIGVGESIQDLIPFESQNFVEAILG